MQWSPKTKHPALRYGSECEYDGVPVSPGRPYILTVEGNREYLVAGDRIVTQPNGTYRVERGED